MNQPLRPISDSELELLKILWDRGSATVRDLHEAIQSAGTDWAYNTVQTLLRRLEEKGYLDSRKEGRAFVFTPKLSREDVLSEELGTLTNRICEGATRPLMLTLVRNRRFTSKEIAQFRELLDELESEEPGGQAEPTEKKPEAKTRRRDKRRR
ncbi:MAG: BlaI/MecI/CopY family transcriptional regulator [Planctomycetota bacterium]